ncbi:MAG: hypothetical protein P8R38_04630, partial [Planctomycetota bacterium]|nr:hypothetical protein [Planctomycetota bacterium]
MKTVTESQQYTMAIFGVFLLWISGCVSIDKQVEKYQQLDLKHYVIVHPEGRRSTPEYQEFALWKTQQGYTVEWISFDPKASPQERFISVSQQLKVAHPGTGQSAYLLIAASHEELPMGPWKPVHTNIEILSDLPLLSGKADLGETLHDSDWRPALTFPPPWIAGRIPYKNPEVAAAALNSARLFQEKKGPRFALLGTERFAIFNDASTVMAGVKKDFQSSQWDTLLMSQDLPRDESLSTSTFTLTSVNKESRTKTVTTLPCHFIDAWKKNSPDVVYVISHSENSELEGRSHIGLGNKILPSLAFFCWNSSEYWPSNRVFGPQTPSILMTTGCQFGNPENQVLSTLTEKGWTAAIIAGTGDTSPLPLFAALRSERSAPRYLAQNLSLGITHHATLSGFLKDSQWDPGNWLLYPWAKKAKLQNVLGLTIYGDPSISIGERSSADD